MGLVDMPFDVKNISIENGEAAAHARSAGFAQSQTFRTRSRSSPSPPSLRQPPARTSERSSSN